MLDDFLLPGCENSIIDTRRASGGLIFVWIIFHQQQGRAERKVRRSKLELVLNLSLSNSCLLGIQTLMPSERLPRMSSLIASRIHLTLCSTCQPVWRCGFCHRLAHLLLMLDLNLCLQTNMKKQQSLSSKQIGNTSNNVCNYFYESMLIQRQRKCFYLIFPLLLHEQFNNSILRLKTALSSCSETCFLLLNCKEFRQAFKD